MSCEAEQRAVDEKIAAVQSVLERELKQIEIDTERRAKEIADEFEANNDLAAGVGAAAGTAIGGVVAGAPGAAAGAVVGRTIGSLFTLEVGMRRQTVGLDVPQIAVRRKDVSFDIPRVAVSDKDVIFDVPTTEMRRQKGPPIPHSTTRMVLKCVGRKPFRVCTKVPEVTVEWRDSWLDVPTVVVKRVRIVIGIPEVTMERKNFSMGIPEVKVDRTNISFDVPYVTIRFVKDAGRRTAAAAAALAQSAQQASLNKQLEFKSRMQTEVAPLVLLMLQCHRSGLEQDRNEAAAPFDLEISKISAAVAAIAARGVSNEDAELKATKAKLEQAIQAKNEAVKVYDAALAKFDEEAKKTMDTFLAGEVFETDSDKSMLMMESEDGDDDDQSEVSPLISYEPS